MSVTRRNFWNTLTAAGVCSALSSAPTRTPNIIMILADDLGYADISAYKVNRFETPNIDRIGMEGVRFTDGYASAPVCAPSRAGLLTGRYQERFGFEYNGGPAQRDLTSGFGLAPGEITIAQLLKDSGYHTGAIGKWHLGMQKHFYHMSSHVRCTAPRFLCSMSFLLRSSPPAVNCRADRISEGVDLMPYLSDKKTCLPHNLQTFDVCGTSFTLPI